jgi:hypothetical protein
VAGVLAGEAADLLREPVTLVARELMEPEIIVGFAGRGPIGSLPRSRGVALSVVWASGLEEDGQGGGESVQEGLAADRADLAAAEEAGERLGPECRGDDARVVVGPGTCSCRGRCR